MAKGMVEDYAQLDLFGNELFFDEPKEEIVEENIKEEITLEEEIKVETIYSNGETIKYKGEDGLFLHPYSKDGKTSAIRLNNSYVVVLTSTIEEK